jgi:hypothetical protein
MMTVAAPAPNSKPPFYEPLLPALRVLAYLSASALSILIVALITVSSWWLAASAPGKLPQRLRWHMVTKTKIPKGRQVKDDDVTWTLGRVSETEKLIPMSKTVVGKYAVNDIESGSSCIPDALSDLALIEAPNNGAAVPVEVKTLDAASLKPGMSLAFVQDKKILPATSAKKTNSKGFLLLSITTSAPEPTITSLIVKVEADDISAVPLLGSGQWRPIALGESKIVSPVQKTGRTAGSRNRRGPHRRRR